MRGPRWWSSDGVSDALRVRRGSELAIAGIVMGVLAETRHPARDPVRGPIYQLGERHERMAEEAHRLGGVDEPSVGRFDAREDRRFSPPLPQHLRHAAGAPPRRPTHT